jgi:uncharacterized protein (TIGR03067 family)
MRRASLVSAYLLPLVARVSLFAQLPSKDLESLQGEWQITKLVGHGNTLLPKDLKEFKFVVDGNRLTYQFVMHNRTVRVEFLFAIDETANPKRIDAKLLNGAYKHKVCPSIYELRGDVLKLCLPEPPINTRPERFQPGTNSGCLFFTLQRSQPIDAKWRSAGYGSN